ncbi:MAG: hypothetical protein WC503_03345 [Candidatus Shapirobacteria bacterium]
MKTTQKYFFLNKTLEILTILLVVILWFCQSFEPLRHPMETNEMDAYSRLGTIITEPKISDGVWLPGFSYIMRIFSPIPNLGIYFNYRIGIYLFTLLSGFVIYRIVNKLTGNFFYSLFALTFFLFHPLTIQLSVLTLTEIVWMFFVLSAAYFLFFSNNQSRYFWALLFYIISQTLRFESWLLIPLIIIYLSINHYQKRKIFFVILSILIFPLYWFFITHFENGYYFSFILSKYYCSTNEFSPLHWNLKNIILELHSLLSIYVFSSFSVFFVLIIGIFQKNKKISAISFTSLYLFVAFILETYVSINENTSPRFFYYLVPTISILFSYLMYFFIKNNIQKNILKILFFISISIFISSELGTINRDYYSKISPESQKIKNIITDLEISKDDVAIFCLPYFEYSTLLISKVDFKVYNCIDEKYLNPNLHGVLIAGADTSEIYNQETWWFKKIVFQNITFYRF